MACCPYAVCSTGLPLLLAVPTVIRKFRALPAGQKVAALLALPVVVFAAAVFFYGAGAVEKLRCAVTCGATRTTAIGSAVMYALLIKRVASDQGATDGARCPVSGKAGECPAAPGAAPAAKQ